VTGTGDEVSYNDAAARRFSMSGALRATAARNGNGDYYQTRNAIVSALATPSLVLEAFNDAPRTTHGDVLAAFDATIAMLEAGHFPTADEDPRAGQGAMQAGSPTLDHVQML